MAISDTTNPYASAGDNRGPIDPGDLPRLDAPQTVAFCYSAELLGAFWTDRTLHSPHDMQRRRRVSLIFASLALLIAVCVGMGVVTARPEGVVGWGAICVMAVVVLFALHVAWRLRTPASVRVVMRQLAHSYLEETPNEHFLSQRTVTLEAEGVREEMPLSHSFTRWSAYERFAQDEEGIYLYDSALSGTIVPREAFATRRQFLGFAALAERLWNEARTAGSHTSEVVKED